MPRRSHGRRIMKVILAGLALGMALSAASAQADDAPPAWAYAVNPPDIKVKPDDGTPQHVPDSTAAFTVTQARDLFFALDWHPSDDLRRQVGIDRFVAHRTIPIQFSRTFMERYPLGYGPR